MAAPSVLAPAARWPTTKYRAEVKMTGETVELVSSARSSNDRMFRFVWTLAPGKRGPNQHHHEGFGETLQVVSGTIRIWLDGVPRDYGPNDVVHIAAGVKHRFLNPTKEPVVINIAHEGTKMEDVFVPVAVASHGRKVRFREMARMLVFLHHTNPTFPTSAVERVMMRFVARVMKLFGVKPHEPVYDWDREAR